MSPYAIRVIKHKGDKYMLFSELNLNDELQDAVKREGFTKATPVQSEAIPACIEGRDIIATAGTGTGKTAAFALPLIQKLMQTERKGKNPRALIITPTRELAQQIHTAISSFTKNIPLSVCSIYGGMPMRKQLTDLKKGKDIIIACPGRLLDHIRQRSLSLKDIEVLVLDEADRMLDMGFINDVKNIVAQSPQSRQTLLFSATFAKEVMRLSKDILNEPQRIALGMEKPPDTIDHSFYPITREKKNELLETLLQEVADIYAIVFTRTKHAANRINSLLNRKGIKANAIHGNKTQSQRSRALKEFKSGKVNILVATDVAARGIDIENVSHVINFDIPETAESYIHRIGRTGRAERQGKAISFVTSMDKGDMRQIEKALGSDVRKDVLPDFDYGSCDPHSMFAEEKKSAFHGRGKRFSPRKRSSRRRGSRV